jgi:DNA-directed RNA polymerase specialized sigma24 family protein
MSVNQEEFGTTYTQCRERLLNSMTTVLRVRSAAEDVTAAAFATAFEKRSSFRGESKLEALPPVYQRILDRATRPLPSKKG